MREDNGVKAPVRAGGWDVWCLEFSSYKSDFAHGTHDFFILHWSYENVAITNNRN